MIISTYAQEAVFPDAALHVDIRARAHAEPCIYRPYRPHRPYAFHNHLMLLPK